MDIRASNKEIGGHKFGQLGYGKDMIDENGSVTFAQADEGDVYYNGAAVATMPLQTAAAAIELISDSAEDDVGGTGATLVIVAGLDGDYKAVSERLIMDGVVAVVGTQLFMRVLGVIALAAGTNETNVGNIDCQAVGGGQIWDRIVAGEGANQHSLITVPAGKEFWLSHWVFTSSALTAQTFKVLARPYGGAWYIVTKRYAYFGGSVDDSVPFLESQSFPEKCDIKMNATVGAAASISSHMFGVLTTTQKG